MIGKSIVPVQGYTYWSIVDGDPRNDTICQIIERADVRGADVMEYGPAFRVRFGDGHTTTAYSSELRPWYPV